MTIKQFVRLGRDASWCTMLMALYLSGVMALALLAYMLVRNLY